MVNRAAEEKQSVSCRRAEQDTRGNYWRHGETDGEGQASGQYTRPVSQAIKRPLWADRRTHRGLCFVCTSVCVCVFAYLFVCARRFWT